MKITYTLTQLIYQSQGLNLEGLILKPEGDGPFPAIVHIHGFNDIGGWDSIWKTISLVKAGYAVFLPSQMGFGQSEGKRDYCGPMTAQGVIDGIKEFMKESFVDVNRIGIWGFSRGSNVTAMLISKYPQFFKAGVLQSGMYDFKKVLKTTEETRMAENMINESGNTEESFNERSPIMHASAIKCPILILHGEEDKTYVVEQVLEFENKLKELKKIYEIQIIKSAGHLLPPSIRKEFIIPFFDKYLK